MKKNRKKFRILLTAVLAVFVLVLDLLFVILPDKELSQVENRKLQRFPVMTTRTLTNGRFESQFDTYVADQFPFRNGFVRLKGAVDLLMGRTESNGVFLGKDGYLIQNFTEPDEEQQEEEWSAIRLFAGNNKVTFASLREYTR